jgi:hypothetical protein
VIDRRGLRAAEMAIDPAPARAGEAEAALRADPNVAEIAHYGGTLRVTTRGGADPTAVVRGAFDARGLVPRELHETRVSVEDAFVEMVRNDERNARAAAAARGAP